jgi:hypothetical protein
MNPETEYVAVVDEIPDDEVHSPFGERWGQQLFKRTPSHLQSLKEGKRIALDVQGDYVVYLEQGQTEKEASHV